MKYKLIKDVIKYMPKSKIKAGEGLEKGIYPFFTSSSIQNKYYDEYIYDDECIIIGTGGHATIHYYKGKFSTSTDNFVVKFNGYNMRFIYHYLQANINILESKFKGAGLKHISKDGLESILLPDIEMEEQTRICKIMDKICNEIKIKKDEIIKLDLLTKSQFVEMFEDSNLIKLGELAKISRGASPRPINRYITSDEKGINWIKIGDVSDTSLYITNAKEKITELGALKSKKVYNGDFILSNSMSFGRPYILRIDGCVHDGWLIISDFKKSFNELYLYYALRDEYVQKQFKGKVNGTTVKNLNSDLVKTTYIKVPPIELQNKFAQIVEQIDKQKFEFEKSLKKLEELQAALMQEYFG